MNILEEIIAYKKEFVKNSKASVPFLELVKKLDKNTSAPRFAEKIRQKGVHLIAEIKKASPSRGIIREDFDAVAIARAYFSGRASCLSVLTDEKFFKGSLSDLDAVSSAVGLPVLRKDFIISEYQVYESKAHQADAILLIAAALKAGELKDLLELARQVGLDALVEVHNAQELEFSLDCGAGIIGINTRNLKDFSVDFNILPELIAKVPPGKFCVSESGIKSAKDLEFFKGLEVHAVLVGEALMRAKDISAATDEFVHVLERL